MYNVLVYTTSAIKDAPNITLYCIRPINTACTAPNETNKKKLFLQFIQHIRSSKQQ